ncbi:hypothetical protein ZYGR_0AY01960 [Zygosaccharomyces rouxii]|uniref:Calcium-transporting ATPase n=1 Tax=Zygosaccharomyces rouxii TaxID=4956 RepID=A0A1Q3AJV7_ZYGRO|nr:hypothetical protein ZYGR_0AY01960 [Zygosaccharomyces rouxii]
MGFSLTAEQLSSMYEPKSLAKFGQLFDEEPAKLYEKLQTDKEQGISDGSRESERYKRYNDNRVPERPPKTFLALAWEAFNDKTMLLLTAAAVVSLALGLYEAFTQPPEYDPDGNKIPRVDWIEGVAIMLAVVVVVLVGTSNDYQKEKQFLKLNRKKEDRQVVVYRNGEEQLISVHDLLVGDLMHLQTGEVVPADCILVDGNCEADESTVTGETDAIKVAPLEQVWKRYVRAIRGGEGNGSSNNSIDPDAADCMLISGSKLISGLGKAVVTAVGVNSVHGKTMMSLKTEPEATPLQERLSELSDSISVFGCASAIILFVVLFIQFLLDIREGGKLADLPAAKRGSQFMSILITSITIIVVAVPEGLPLAVTLSLAFATTRMTKDGNLVRVLSACETMGSATAVCSDKTGTLTENRMTVVKGYLGSSEFDEVAENSGNTEVTMKSMLEGKISEDIKQDVLANIVLNSTAFENKKFQEQQQHHEEEQGQRLRGNTSDNPFSSILTRGKSRLENLLHSGDEDLATPQVKSVEEPYIGSKTETALLTMASKNFGLGNLKEWRQNHKDHFKIAKIVQVIPFESSRKWGGIVVKYEGEKKYRFFVKGAAEIIFSRTLYHRNSNGSLVKLDGQGRQIIDEHIQGLASDALRAISIAHKDLNYEGTWPPQNIRDDEENEALPDKLFGEVVNEKSQDGFVLDALVGIQDPLRPGVKNSIEQCQKAGVTIRMVTGDNITTARAIARNCSILSEEDWVDSDCAMEGPKFRELSNDERVKILPKLRVLARSSPEDKKILVGTLKQMGDVVASTGDGTNDAPALKMADVGFSMGIAGTEVAREASDIILMTDDFTAIVNAIKWGRCVSGSIKKFIQFQLTVNVTAVVLTFISSVTTGKSVLTAVQLLWVNLIMDTLAALALATDRPDANIMDRKPVGRQAPLISVSSWKMIMCQSILQLAVTLTLTYRSAQIFFGREVTNHEKEMLNACTFNTFVWLQFFTLFVSRKLDEADGVKSWRQRISRENLDFSQDLGRNGYFLGVMAVIGFFQVFIMKFGGVAFSIAEQTPSMWACAIISSLLSIPIGALVRICPDEVALAIYPKRFIGIVWYIGSLGFFKKNAKRGLHDDEESLLGEAQEESSISTRSDNYT